MIKISIITAVFNSKATIGSAIESVINQSGVNIELIVIDGGSTDGTLDILKQFSDQIAVLVSEPDLGIYDALNKGIRHSTGDVVGFLHADDFLADSRVLSDISSIFMNSDVGCIYGDLQYVSKEEPSKVIRYWQSGDFKLSNLTKGWMPPHPTLYVRRQFYAQIGEFNINYRIAADYDFILRLFSLPELKPVYLRRVIVKMRVGGASNRSLNNIIRKSLEDWKVLRSNRIGGLFTLMYKNFSKIGQFFSRRID
jgi:glycosyltransferase involved in cell wall biosynthesis